MQQFECRCVIKMQNRSHHFVDLRNITISKCCPLSLERRGVNIRSPNKNKRSIAARAGMLVFILTYSLYLLGYSANEDTSIEELARYLSTSSSALLFALAILFCRLAANTAKKSRCCPCC